MNRKSIFGLSAALCAGILLLSILFWVSPSRNKHNIGNWRGDGTSSESVKESLSDSLLPSPSSSGDAIGARLANLLDGPRPDYTKEQVQAFVDERSRDIVSLMAAYSLLTHKADTDAVLYLQEALERFPNNEAIVAMALIEAFDGNLDADIETLTSALSRFDPDNSLPMVLKASELLKNERTEDALSEIGHMIDHKLETFDSVIANARKVFFKSTGWGDTEASLIAAQKFATLPVLNTLTDIRRDLLAALADAQDSETKEAIIAAGVITGQQITNGYSLLLTLGQLRQEMQFFSNLDGDMQSKYFGGQLKGSELLASAERDYNEVQRLSAKKKNLLASVRNPRLAQEFGTLLVNEGEIIAYRWLADKVDNNK